jgi:hypothetical protein
VAQLGARFHGMEEVVSSNLTRSTKTSPNTCSRQEQLYDRSRATPRNTWFRCQTRNSSLGEASFKAPERQNELTRRIQQKLADAGKKPEEQQTALRHRLGKRAAGELAEP